MKMIVLISVFLFSGCAELAINNRPAEISQAQYVAGGYRAGAEVVVANQYQATNADVYIYLGNRSKEELLLNINGQNVVLKEYIRDKDKKKDGHFWLMNASDSQTPEVKVKLLDVGRCYTVLMVVHWGIAGDYTIETRSFCTTTDATRDKWRDGFGRPYYANVIIQVPGTDQAAMNRFNPVINVYPNNAARELLRGIGIGR